MDWAISEREEDEAEEEDPPSWRFDAASEQEFTES